MAHTGRNEPAFGPDEAYIPDVAHKIVKDGDDIGMTEFISKRNLGEQANSNTGQNRSPDRFDTVRREIPLNRTLNSTFSPHERPIRPLCYAAIQEAVVVNEFCGDLWYPVALEIKTGPDAYKRGDRDAPDNRVGFVDEAHAYRQVDPIFHHIAHDVGENEIHLKARIE